MLKPESIELAKSFVEQGKTAQEIWSFFSEFDKQALEVYWKIPRNNINQFITDCAVKMNLQGPVIDVGCGIRSHKNEVLKYLKDKTIYIAFDHYVRKQTDNLQCLLDLSGDATHIPLADGSCGTVICTEVLEHVPEDKLVLFEINRILKRNGLLILTLPGAGIPKHEKLPYQVDYRRYNVDEIKNKLLLCGYSNSQIFEKYLWELQVNILISAQKNEYLG